FHLEIYARPVLEIRNEASRRFWPSGPVGVLSLILRHLMSENGPTDTSTRGFRVFQFEADADLRLKYISNSICSICGYAPEELLGRPVQLLFPEMLNESTTNGLQLLSKGEPPEHRFETPCRHKNGSTFTVELCGRLAKTPS